MQEQLDARFMLRVPDALRARVERSAKNNRRSMNSEIIILLERALPPENEKAEAVATASAE
jgi:hypothetical protein